MATFNLVRNSRVFFTTNVNSSTGVVQSTGFTTSNAKEIQVLDGFSFTQATNADTVQISEAGSTPVRGQRTFNTSLNNVEITFSTYLRPNKPASLVTCEESVLWNALLCDQPVGTEVTIGGTVSTATYSAVTGILTIGGSAMTYVGVAVGDYVVVSGLTGTGASQANVAAKILTLTAASITLQLLSAPAGALTLAIGTLKFARCAWTENAAVTGDLVVGNTPYAQATTALSNKNQLQKFGMIIKVDGITYVIDNCAMDQASIDFTLDGIAMVAWTAKGTKITEKSVTWANLTTNPTLTGDLTGTLQGKVTTAQYITNKLSTVTLAKQVGGGGTPFTLALTGGNITIANNINYVIPANLGTVNEPIGYFTGTRAISGNLTAYLRTGSGNTAGLLNTLLADSSTNAENYYQLGVAIGGLANAIRVETLIFGAMLQIPTIDAQAVMSTTINFTAQGTDFIPGANAGYDLENTNDLQIRYFSS